MESELKDVDQITKVVSRVEGSTGAYTEDIDSNEEDSRNNCNFGDEKDLKISRNYEIFDAENDTENLHVEQHKEKCNMPGDAGNHHRIYAETTCENGIDYDGYLKIKNDCPANDRNDRDETVDGAGKYEKNAEILQIADNALLEVDENSALEVDENSALEDLVTENSSVELTSHCSPNEEEIDQCEKMEGKCHSGLVQTIELREREEKVEVPEKVTEKPVQNEALVTDNVGEVGVVVSVPQSERSVKLTNNEDYNVRFMEDDAKQRHENTEASPDIVTVPESLSLSDIRNLADFEPLSTEEICENGAASIDQTPALRNNEELGAENVEDERFLDNNTDDIVNFLISTIGIDACVSVHPLGPEFCGGERKAPDIPSEETPKPTALEQIIHLAQNQGEDTNEVLGSPQMQGVLPEPYPAVKTVPSGNKVCEGQSSEAHEEERELTCSRREIPLMEWTTGLAWMPEATEHHPIEQQDFSFDGPGQEFPEVGITEEVTEDHLIENQEVSLGEHIINEQLLPNVEIPEVGLTDEEDSEIHPIENQKFSLDEQSNCEQAPNVSIAEHQQEGFLEPSPKEAVEMETRSEDKEDEASGDKENSAMNSSFAAEGSARGGIEQVETVEPIAAVKENVTTVTEVAADCNAESMQNGTQKDQKISMKTDDPTIHAPEDEPQASEETGRVQSNEGNREIQENKDQVCLNASGLQQEPSTSNASQIANAPETQTPAVSLRFRRHVIQDPHKKIINHDDTKQHPSPPNEEEVKSLRDNQGGQSCSFVRGLFDDNFARRADKSRENVPREERFKFLCCTPKEEGDGCWCCSLLCWLFGYRY